jgi:hypothetical protein
MSFMDIFSINSVDSIVDAVIDTGDAIVYTPEERAKAEQLKTETKLKMLPLYEPFKLAQRYIAFAFTANFILSFWVGFACLYFDFKVDDYIKLITTFQLGWIMIAIVSFYFGGGFVAGFQKVKKI